MIKQVYNESQSWRTIRDVLIATGLLLLINIPLFFLKRTGEIDSSAIWTVVIVNAIVLLTFFLHELRTRIDDKGIHIHFFPWIKRNYSWEDIAKTEFIRYGFVGGWGIRWGTNHGTVYNIRGKEGLKIWLKNGKTVVMGTSQPERLRESARRLPTDTGKA